MSDPVADFTVTYGLLQITVDASTSAAQSPGATITGWQWSFGDDTPRDDSGPVVTHDFDYAGFFDVDLTVTDSNGDQGSTRRSISVTSGDPTARATATVAGLVVTVDASTSSAISGATITSYAWDWADGSPAGAGMSTSHTYTAGYHYVHLTVTDSNGRTGTADVTVHVVGGSTPPPTPSAQPLSGWTSEDSQAATIDAAGLHPSLQVTAAVDPIYTINSGGPPPAPGAVAIRLLRKVTPVLADRPALVDGRPGSTWAVTSVDDSDLGRPQLVIDGIDVTMFRGAPVTVTSISDAEPFGDGAAEFVFAGITPLDTPGTGDLAWLRGGADAELWLIRPDGSRDPDPWWAGYLVSSEPSYSATTATWAVQANGALWQGDLIRHTVAQTLAPTDIGDVIAGALNGIPGRRYSYLAPVATGILTSQRGSGTTEVGYVQGLLATATTEDGASQWTVARAPGVRCYALAVKDRTTVHVTLQVGQPGLSIGQLVRDVTAGPNVYYGSGVGPDGYAWSGVLYPQLHTDDAPPYPMATAAATITVGTTDAGTASGDGVSAWQQRAKDLGYGTRVTGRFSAADARALRAIQAARGLQVDGVLGPQSWAATFDVGSNGGDLASAIRLPLAADPAVMPFLYTATGGFAGLNPAYNPSRLRVEVDTNYGAGISKADGRRSAVAELARSSDPGWVGTLTLDVDPPQMSRLAIRSGMNVLLAGWAGGDLLLHVAGRTITDLGQVTLTVDSRGRDFLSVAALITRDAAAAADVARRPGKTTARSSTTQDVVVDFDGESGAGVIPRHALYGGLWTVLRIPVSQVGRIARFDYATESPAVRFSLALFGAPITPADLVRLVGDPLNEPEDGDLGPYVLNLETLEDDWGFIEAFGTGEQGAGYYPGSASDGNPVTGRMKETAAIEYVSANPPWLWLAEYAPTSTFASGRMYPAPVS